MKNIIIILPICILALTVVKILIEVRKDYIYDNVKCKIILINELLKYAKKLNKLELSATYRVNVAASHLLLSNKLDRRVVNYYKNHREFINNKVAKILTNGDM